MLLFHSVEKVCSGHLPELTFDTALATVVSFDLSKLGSFADTVQLCSLCFSSRRVLLF